MRFVVSTDPTFSEVWGAVIRHGHLFYPNFSVVLRKEFGKNPILANLSEITAPVRVHFAQSELEIQHHTNYPVEVAKFLRKNKDSRIRDPCRSFLSNESVGSV